MLLVSATLQVILAHHVLGQHDIMISRCIKPLISVIQDLQLYENEMINYASLES